MTDPLGKRVVFITHTACGVPELEEVGLGLGPNTNLENHYVGPLREVFSEVVVYDLGQSYAHQGSKAANQGLVRLVEQEQPDFVLWHSMMYELSEEAALAIRATGARLVGWFSDDEFRFDDYSRWWAPVLDWCLTTDENAVWAYCALGGRATRMPWGSNRHFFRRTHAPYAHDVSFVGRRFGTRGEWVSSLRTAGIEVAAYGRNWPEGYISEERLVEVYNSSRINLCFVAADTLGESRAVLKGRIFDVCMSGGFLLCEAVPGIEEFFTPGFEVELFSDLDEAGAKIRYYLDHEQERTAIADAGWRRAQQDHAQAGRFRMAFGAIAAGLDRAPSRADLEIPLREWSLDARWRRAQWHYSWAEGLFEARFPRERVEEEILLCLRSDPGHARAKDLQGRLVGSTRRRQVTAAALHAGQLGKQSARTAIAAIPGAVEARRQLQRAKASRRSAAMASCLQQQVDAVPTEPVAKLFEGALSFAESLRDQTARPGLYRYSPSGSEPLVYSSVYAALLRHLLGDLDRAPSDERQEWAEYLNSFQCPDGLYRDPRLACMAAELEDWWGWRHLTAHIVGALACLGSKPARPFAFLERMYRPGVAGPWIASLNWERRPDFTSNTVMNYGVLLQYARDFDNVTEAGQALEEIYEHLDRTQDSETGLWGMLPTQTSDALACAVQTSYHVWMLYFYDGRLIRFADRAVENCVRLQNRLGGFSPRPNSSACDDIDAVDMLARLGHAGVRPKDISAALRAAIRWTWANRVDGGLVFRRCEGFRYGHELMTTGADEPHLFGTWFRTLAVAYAISCLGEPASEITRLRWCVCPGYQYWMPERVRAESEH